MLWKISGGMVSKISKFCRKFQCMHRCHWWRFLVPLFSVGCVSSLFYQKIFHFVPNNYDNKLRTAQKWCCWSVRRDIWVNHKDGITKNFNTFFVPQYWKCRRGHLGVSVIFWGRKILLSCVSDFCTNNLFRKISWKASFCVVERLWVVALDRTWML